MTDSDFQLETHSVEVEVVLRDRRTLLGCVFLRPAAGKHLGAETLDDRLNESQAFFPVLHETGVPRDALLVGKSAIAYVKAPKPTDDRSRSARSQASEVNVTIQLMGQPPLSGMIYLALPQGRSRTLDWLNTQSTFVPLIVGSHILYLHRDAIQTVRDHNPSITVPPTSSETPNTTRS